MSFKADPPPPAVTVTKIAYPGPVIGNPLRRKTHFDCNLHLEDNCVISLFSLWPFLFFMFVRFAKGQRFGVLPEMLVAKFIFLL